MIVNTMRVCILLAQSVFFYRYLNRFFLKVFWAWTDFLTDFRSRSLHHSPVPDFSRNFLHNFFHIFLPFKISKVIKSYMFLKKMAHSFYVAFLRASIWVGYKLLFEASRGKLSRNTRKKWRQTSLFTFPKIFKAM